MGGRHRCRRKGERGSRDFLATGLSQEATAGQAHGEKKDAARLFAQALAALDESRPEHADLRKQLIQNLKELEVEVKPKDSKRATGRGDKK